MIYILWGFYYILFGFFCVLFLGIQMVLRVCRDFFQLPIVAKEFHGYRGKHCIRTKFFDKSFPHRVNLHIIYRQSDQDLI